MSLPISVGVGHYAALHAFLGEVVSVAIKRLVVNVLPGRVDYSLGVVVTRTHGYTSPRARVIVSIGVDRAIGGAGLRGIVSIGIPGRGSAEIGAAVVVGISPAISAAVGPAVPARISAIYGEMIADAVNVVRISSVRALQKATASDVVGVSLLVGCVFQGAGSDTGAQEVLAEVGRWTHRHAQHNAHVVVRSEVGPLRHWKGRTERHAQRNAS